MKTKEMPPREPLQNWGEGRPTPRVTIKKAVRLFCLECNGQTRVSDNNDCISRECFLHWHRPWNKENKKKVSRKSVEAGIAAIHKARRRSLQR